MKRTSIPLLAGAMLLSAIGLGGSDPRVMSKETSSTHSPEPAGCQGHCDVPLLDALLTEGVYAVLEPYGIEPIEDDGETEEVLEEAAVTIKDVLWQTGVYSKEDEWQPLGPGPSVTVLGAEDTWLAVAQVLAGGGHVFFGVGPSAGLGSYELSFAVAVDPSGPQLLAPASSFAREQFELFVGWEGNPLYGKPVEALLVGLNAETEAMLPGIPPPDPEIVDTSGMDESVPRGPIHASFERFVDEVLFPSDGDGWTGQPADSRSIYDAPEGERDAMAYAEVWFHVPPRVPGRPSWRDFQNGALCLDNSEGGGGCFFMEAVGDGYMVAVDGWAVPGEDVAIVAHPLDPEFPSPVPAYGPGIQVGSISLPAVLSTGIVLVSLPSEGPTSYEELAANSALFQVAPLLVTPIPEQILDLLLEQDLNIGETHVFALREGGVMGHRWLTLTDGWRPWESLAEPSNAPRMVGYPAVAQGAGGVLAVFAWRYGGCCWWNRQSHLGGPWVGWEKVGEPTAPGGYPTVAANTDGRLEVFTVANGQYGLLPLGELLHPVPTETWNLWTGNVWHAAQVEPGGEWSPWENLGGGVLGGLALTRRTDGTLEVFARAAQGQAILHMAQSAPGGEWSDGWSSLGDAANAGGHIGGVPGVGTNADGSLEVFAQHQDGGIYHRRRGVLDWSGSDWERIPPPPGVTLHDPPTLTKGGDGRLHLFTNSWPSIWHASQDAPNGTVWAWENLGGAASCPVAVPDPDGGITLMASNGTQLVRRRLMPGVGWSEWELVDGTVKNCPALIALVDA